MACKDCFVISYRIFSYILFRFRWVFCQLETLRHCLPPSVRGILAELPETLDETYERILREIPKTNRVHAHRLLQCLTVAVRPLAVAELAEVLAINFDTERGIPKLNEGFRWADQEQAVLSACSSLVAIVEDGNSRRVQSSHFSVKEFLTSDRLAASAVDVLRHHHIHLEPAHTIMAQACLGVLLRLDHHMDKMTIESYPLAKYAGQCFVDHAKFGDVLSHIIDGLDNLLDPDKPHFDTWLWLCHGDWGTRRFAWNSAFNHWYRLPTQSNSENPVPDYPPRTSPLYYAVKLGYTCLAQYLILRRPHDLDASDIYGTTALHIAAFKPNCKVAQMLVERTAAIDVRDNNGRTPLHYATRDGGWDYDEGDSYDDGFDCVRLLLDSGASAEAQNNDGSTPLHVAASKMTQEIVQLLIENSTNIDLRNNKGQTALHKASQRGQPDIIQLILNHGADVDAPDNDGSTPLHLAISGRSSKEASSTSSGEIAISEERLEEVRLETVQLLLKHGANVNLQDHIGQAALHKALQCGHLGIIELILNHNADVDALDHDGSTPLHLAISEPEASLEAVQLFLKHGASVHTQNNQGETLFQAASARGLQEIAELLSMHIQREQMT
jgi:ankyrin repeat protein